MPDFRYDLSVDVHDLDYNGICKTSSLMKYIQSAAQSQLTGIGLSYDELKKRNRAFIISKIKMEFFEPIRAYEALTAISFPCESRGFRFLRGYELHREGVCIGRAVSVWALVDIHSRALIRTEDFDLPLPLAPMPTSLPSPIRLPADGQIVGTYDVHYAELDQNGHMNNTRYPNIYAQFLPLEGSYIRTISISYVKEARAGEVLTVRRAQADGVFYFETLLSDGTVNSQARLTLAPIE